MLLASTALAACTLTAPAWTFSQSFIGAGTVVSVTVANPANPLTVSGPDCRQILLKTWAE